MRSSSVRLWTFVDPSNTRWAHQMRSDLRQMARISPPAAIVVELVSARRMAMLNEQYRARRGPTTVLTFVWTTTPLRYAEVFLCVSEIQRRKAPGTTLKNELRRFLVHGVVHALGHDHKKNNNERIFTHKERKLCRLLSRPHALRS